MPPGEGWRTGRWFKWKNAGLQNQRFGFESRPLCKVRYASKANCGKCIFVKHCYKCKTHKEEGMFHKNKSQRDGLATYCKPCAKERNRQYYIKTPERNTQRRRSSERLRAKCREFVWMYLLENPCVDCGESDPVVLEFDHVRGEKLDSVSILVSQTRSVAIVEEEIKKCEVRCANCHRRVTASRGGWYSGPSTSP